LLFLLIKFIDILAAQGDHVDAARILLYYKSTLVDDVSSVS
jgi:hypothetical protein